MNCMADGPGAATHSMCARTKLPIAAGKRVGRALAGAALAFILPMAGASAQGAAAWDTVRAAAKAEGKVVFYSAQTPAALARLVGGFKKAHPEISIEVLRATSADVLTKIEQERAAGIDGADVVITSDVGWLTSLAKAGQLQKPAGPAAAAWPAKYVFDAAVVMPGIEPFVIPYNTALVTSPPPSSPRAPSSPSTTGSRKRRGRTTWSS